MARYLAGRAFVLTHSFDDDENTALVISSVTVSVAAEDGTVVSTGSATGSGGTYSYTVPASAAVQGAYKVTWTANTNIAVDVEYHEVVGALSFTVKQFRGSDIDLQSTAKFTAADIRFYRDDVEVEFERITGRSFTPRTTRRSYVLDGTGTVYTGIFDIASVLSATLDGTAVDTAEWSIDPLGIIEGVSGASGAVLDLVVDYGFRACPPDVSRAAMLRTKALIVRENSGIPDRASSFIAAEGGTYTLATPGLRGSETGIPEVDAVLGRYRYRILQDLVGG